MEAHFLSTQQQDTHAKAGQYASHNVMLENGTHKAKASFLELSPTSCTCRSGLTLFWGAPSGCTVMQSCPISSKELFSLCPAQGVQAAGCCSPCSNQDRTAQGYVCESPAALHHQSPGLLQAPSAATRSQDQPLAALKSWRHVSLVPMPDPMSGDRA